MPRGEEKPKKTRFNYSIRHHLVLIYLRSLRERKKEGRKEGGRACQRLRKWIPWSESERERNGRQSAIRSTQRNKASHLRLRESPPPPGRKDEVRNPRREFLATFSAANLFVNRHCESSSSSDQIMDPVRRRSPSVRPIVRTLFTAFFTSSVGQTRMERSKRKDGHCNALFGCFFFPLSNKGPSGRAGPRFNRLFPVRDLFRALF